MEDEEYQLDIDVGIEEDKGSSSSGDYTFSPSEFLDTDALSKEVNSDEASSDNFSDTDISKFNQMPNQSFTDDSSDLGSNVFDKNRAESDNLGDIYQKKDDADNKHYNKSDDNSKDGHSNTSPTGSDDKDLSKTTNDRNPNNSQPVGDTNKPIADDIKSASDDAKSAADAAKSAGDSAKSAADAAKSAGDSAKSAADAAKSSSDFNPLDSVSNVLEKGGKNEDLNLKQRVEKEAVKQIIGAEVPGSQVILNSERGNRALNELMRANRFERTTGLAGLKSLGTFLKKPEDASAGTDSNGDLINSEGKKLDDTVDESSLENSTVSFSKTEKKNILIPVIIVSVCFVFLCCIVMVAAKATSAILENDLAASIGLNSEEIQNKLLSGEDTLVDDYMESQMNDDSNNSTGSGSTSTGANYPSGSKAASSHAAVMVDVALKEYEKNKNGQSSAYTYQSAAGVGSGASWCGFFVTYVAKNSVYNGKSVYDIVGSGTGAGSYMNRFNTVSGLKFYYNDSCSLLSGKNGSTKYAPKPGDYIFFDFDHEFRDISSVVPCLDGTGPCYQDHIGLVEKYESGTIYTVEGNSSDPLTGRPWGSNDSSVVGRHKYSISDCDVIGFGSWY